MSNVQAGALPALGTLPQGVTLLEAGSDGFLVLSIRWQSLDRSTRDDGDAFAARIGDAQVTAVALDMEGVSVPTDREASLIRDLVDALQLRGISVVLHDVSGGFLTAASMDGDLSRFACQRELSAAVDALRSSHAARVRLTWRVGHRLNQLRLPATALGVPALCAFARDRLESGGLRSQDATDVLREAYAAMMDAVSRLGTSTGSLSVSATVHDARATLTLLDDAAPPCDGDCSVVRTGSVDRIHAFRIDDHNATVIEKDL